MSDQLGKDVPSETEQAWDTVRRVREPIAWTLLAIAAIIVLVSACQLFHLAGATIPVVPGPPTVSAFALRASSVAPQFIDAAVQAMPVLAVVLVAFCGGLTKGARQVIQTAAVILAAAFVLGLISLEGAAASHTRPGTWFFLEVPGLAITATALIFTGAVMWSRPFRLLAPGQHDLGGDDDFAGRPASSESPPNKA
jgi:hypothetical protein